MSGDGNGNGLLDPGETWVFSCPGSVTEPTVNVARITGQPSAADGQPLPGVDPVSDDAVAFVDVVEPGIDITKTAVRSVVLDDDAQPVSGPDTPTPRPAEYRYDVANTGNVPLSLAGAAPTDDICEPLVFEGGDANGDDLLDVGEIWTYSCTTPLGREQANTPPVTGRESGLVTNTATVTGVPWFAGGLVPDKAVTDTDIAQVTVIEPGLALVKTASPEVVRAGDEVVYRFAVRNTGDVGLTVLDPTDDKCAPLVYQGGDRNGNGILEGANSAAAETWRYACARPVGQPEPPATTDVNIASVEGVDPLGNVYAASDDAEVRVLDPAINLTKAVSDSLVPSGHTVTYTFQVSNSGQSPIPADDVLERVRLRDVSLPTNPGCAQPAYVSGDTDGDGLLPREPAEVWTYQCRGTITEPTNDVAVVIGHAGAEYGLDIPVVDAAWAFVQPFHPAIQVVKSADPKLLSGGGDVTYTYEVTNTGDVPLADVAERISDDTCSPVAYVSGDTDGDGLLDTQDSIFEDALDETWLFTCTTTVDKTTTNTVVVTGTPTDGGGQPLCGQADGPRVSEPCDVRDRDRETVRVVVPASITIVKRTTAPTGKDFGFALGGHGFTLGDGDARTFDDLLPGAYRVREDPGGRWKLRDIACSTSGGAAEVDLPEASVLITVQPGDHVTCTFTNAPRGGAGPPPPPGGGTDNGGELPGTGAPPWLGQLLVLGALLVLFGAGALEWRRRRLAAA